MFEPSKYKFRKAFKGRIRGSSPVAFTPQFGSYALKAVGVARINGKHIESARKVINRSLKRRGKLWIRVYPSVPVSKKPADVRMGKGKGSTEMWVSRIKPGRVIFELDGVAEEQAKEALVKAASKLPVKCVFVADNYGGII